MIKLLIGAAILAVCPVSVQGLDSTEPTTSVVSSSSEEGAIQTIEEWASGFLSAQTITTLLTVLSFLAVIVKLARDLKAMKNEKNLTLKNVTDSIMANLDKTLPDEISKSINQYLPSLVEYAEKSDKIMVAFAKILALSQENTPDAKVAILGLIQELGVISNSSIEESKKKVIESAQAKKEAEEKTKESVKTVIAETSKTSYDGTGV